VNSASTRTSHRFLRIIANEDSLVTQAQYHREGLQILLASNANLGLA